MIIRKTKISDYDSITSLYKQLHEAEKKYDNNLIDEYNIDKEQEKIIKKRIRSRKDIFLVAEIDNKIIGLIYGEIPDIIFYKEKVSFLKHLCVDKEYRNKSIATKLIQEFSDKSQEKGAIYIRLNAFEKNTNAVNLYKKMGFEEYSIYYNKKI